MKLKYYLSNMHLRRGFTVVEILIVIVVIAIIAAIALVSYTTLRVRGIESTMQSDLRQSAAAIENDNTRNGTFPADLSVANKGAGIEMTQDNQASYRTAGKNYCLTITNPATSKSFYVDSVSRTVKQGVCEAYGATVAGMPLAGGSPYVDAQGTAARFNVPRGINFHSASGNIYVADSWNTSIRVISPTLAVTTLVTDNGNCDNPIDLCNPLSAVADSAGNVFIANDWCNIIRISSGGVRSIFAGTTAQVCGETDGTGTAATFGQITDIAIDSANNLYVINERTTGSYPSYVYNTKIRKITPAGVVTTLAGSGQGSADGTGAAASFNRPQGIGVNSNTGDVYVADMLNNKIRKVTQAGVVTTVAGSGTAGLIDTNGTSARFYRPEDVVVAGDGSLYVSDTYNSRVRKIAINGDVSTIAGSDSGTQGCFATSDGPGSTMKFCGTRAITIDNNGILYVSDEGSNVIYKIIP